MPNLNYLIEVKKNLPVVLILQIKGKLISEQVHSQENYQRCQTTLMLQQEKLKKDLDLLYGTNNTALKILKLLPEVHMNWIMEQSITVNGQRKD